MQKYHQIQLENSFQFFSKFTIEQRAKYYQKVFDAKQNQSPPSKVYLKQYPSSSNFTYQQYKLNYYQLKTSDQPKAIIIHFHGYRSHGGVTGYYADVIASRNPHLNAYSFDQANFGKSQGPCKGYIQSMEDSVAQGEAFIQYLLTTFNSKPKIFLSGSSFGGAIIFKMAIKRPQRYSGLIFLAPALRDVQSSQCLKKFARFVGWLAPRAHFSNEMSSKESTKFNCDSLIKNDPNYESSLVPGAVRTVLNAMQEISTTYSSLSTPYICIQGGMDKLVDLFAPVDLHNQSSSKDKQTIYYKNMWHGIMYEEQVEHFSNIVAEWIKKRV